MISGSCNNSKSCVQNNVFSSNFSTRTRLVLSPVVPMKGMNSIHIISTASESPKYQQITNYGLKSGSFIARAGSEECNHKSHNYNTKPKHDLVLFVQTLRKRIESHMLLMENEVSAGAANEIQLFNFLFKIVVNSLLLYEETLANLLHTPPKTRFLLMLVATKIVSEFRK